jgi:WD40 repeat protein
VLDIAFSPDDKIFASSSKDKSIIIWSTENLSFKYILQQSDFPIISIAFSNQRK